ncbi:MAG: fumarate hydratase, partial [Candidatus Electrothrix sp. AR3]|nr:fumarate hydratase [Candidatus Electrothrix sp. AR3]
MTDFIYHDPFPLGEDQTTYYPLEGSGQYVSIEPFAGTEIVKVTSEGLQILARQAMHDVSFFLRPEHNQQVAAILDDPEASDNDQAVALAMLRN